MTKKFKALESVKTDQGNQLSIIERSIDDLPEGELLIKVHYSSLNYKLVRGISNNWREDLIFISLR